MTVIDLNCDMGESFGIYTLGNDEEIMTYVSSINVACGFHASDPINMLNTVKLAKKYGVAVGAHPAFPDLLGFGRRRLAATLEEIRADVVYQIGALLGFCRAEGVKLQHVKAHGALYNMAEEDINIAAAIAEAVKAVDGGLYMVCMANSAMVEAARRVGVKYVEEVFADRAYTAQGRLAPRNEPGAVIQDAGLVAKRVVEMVKFRQVTAIDGVQMPVSFQTVCVHGDTDGALKMIRIIRKKLSEEGMEVKAFGG